MAAAASDVAARISCADSAFRMLSHEAALMVIRDLEIGAVDIGVFAGYRHTPPEAVMEDPVAASDRVRARLERHELAVADVFAILGEPFDALAVNHPDRAEREESLRQFDRLVEFTRRVGGAGVTVLPGGHFEGVTEEASLALAASELQRRAEIAGEAGVAFACEPHVGSVLPSPAVTLELLERAPNVGVTLDPTHFVFVGMDQEELGPLMPRTRHVHLRQAAEGVIQAPVHEGSIDIARFVRRLDEAGYSGYLAIEYQWDLAMDFNRVDCISETAAMRDLLLTTASRGDRAQ
jgi:sugar phosphate isomerase/epimerase